MKFYKFLFLIICTVGLSGCSKIVYLNEVEPYSDMLNKRYKLVADCFIVQDLKKKYRSKYPQIICNVSVPGIGNSMFPRFASPNDIGKTYADLEVLEILPKGSTFVLKSVREERTVEMRLVYFEVLFDDQNHRSIGPLDAISILDGFSPPYDFHEAVAVEIR